MIMLVKIESIKAFKIFIRRKHFKNYIGNNILLSGTSGYTGYTGPINLMAQYNYMQISNTNYNILSTDAIIGIASMTGPTNIILPATGSIEQGKAFHIVDESGTASSTGPLILGVNNVTIDTINNSTGVLFTVNYQSISTYYSGNNKWFIF